MSEEIYELLALAARYWFVLLMAVIVCRGWITCVRDNRRVKQLRKKHADASYVGELLVEQDGYHGRLKGKRFKVPVEGMLGSGRVADVRIRHRAVAKRHLWLRYSDGYLTLRQLSKAGFSAPRTEEGVFVLCDGDHLEIGPLTMTLLLYDAQEIAEPEAGARQQTNENYVTEYKDEFWG